MIRAVDRISAQPGEPTQSGSSPPDECGGCRASLHSTWHTMVTLARRGGARKGILEQVTHNARGDIVDRYKHRDCGA